MKILKTFTIIVFVVGATLAQAKTLVVDTASVKAVGYKDYVATAYCLQGKMSNGQRVSAGSVAVDSGIIPLGSTLDVLGMGIFKASDTGGDIKRNRLDFWFNSCSAAKKFGRRIVKVKVIPKLVRKI